MIRYITGIIALLFLISNDNFAQEEYLLDYTIGSDSHRYEWQDYEKYEYTTNIDGSITEKVFFVSGPEELEPQYKNEYEYDQQGNLLHETEYVMGAEQWSAYKRTSYSYYPNGSISEKKLFSYVVNEWQETYRYLFNYDQNANPIDIIESRKTGDEWQKAVRTLHEYTDDLLMKTTYKEWSNEAWSNVQKLEYTYNVAGNRTSSNVFFWYEDWALVTIDRYQYNTKNLLSNETHLSLDEGEEIIHEEIKFEYYDNDSLKTKYHTLEPLGKNDIHKTEYVYIPQENTRIEILKYQKYFEWNMNQKKVYVYNKDGNLKSEENYGWSQNRWLDNWKRIINYDEKGFIDVENSYLYESIGFGKSDSVKNHYKEGGLIDMQECFRWEFGLWKKYKEKHFSGYDNGMATEIVTQYIASDAVVHSISERYEFDDDYNLTQEKMMTMKDAIWIDSLKYAYSYDDDKMDKWTLLEWDGSMWKYKKRNLYVYNTDDRVSYRKEQYSAGTDVWLDHVFNYYSYNENQQLAQILQEFSDKPDLQKKQEYFYNDDAMISEIRYSEKYSEWSPTHTHFFQYDENGKMTSEYEMTKSSNIYNQIDYFYDWLNSVKKFDNGAGDFQVYPNPFVSELNLSFTLVQGDTVSIGLYDSQGVLQISPKNNIYSFGDNTITMKTDFLPSGVYYLIIDIGNKSYMEKLTKVK